MVCMMENIHSNLCIDGPKPRNLSYLFTIINHCFIWAGHKPCSQLVVTFWCFQERHLRFISSLACYNYQIIPTNFIFLKELEKKNWILVTPHYQFLNGGYMISSPFQGTYVHDGCEPTTLALWINVIQQCTWKENGPPLSMQSCCYSY